MFELKIAEFADGGDIPNVFTCDGADESPSLFWSGEPPTTRSYALILDDPDAPCKTWNHWLLWDIPRTIHSLPRNYRTGPPAISGTNDFGRPGYGGPCPPKGHGTHRYVFHLYALDAESLDLPPKSTRKELDHAMRKHILATAECMGRFARQ